MSIALKRRDPVQTRERLLQCAFDEIHAQGFQAASLETILKHTGVTKGALYHHFPNKHALGYAVLDEVIRPKLAQGWIEPLAAGDDVIGLLQQMIRAAGEGMTLAELRLGCPLNNLSQEMSPVDEGFRQRIEVIYDAWRDAIAMALQRGIVTGHVREGVDVQRAAAFIVASLEGCIGMAKAAQSLALLWQCGHGLLDYLDSLRG